MNKLLDFFKPDKQTQEDFQKRREALLSHQENSVLTSTVMPPAKTTKEMVEQIHKEFYTAVDQLLAESKVELSTETKLEHLLERSRKLKQLGFDSCLDITEAKAEETRLTHIGWENAARKRRRDAITYFQEKYPLYKFITPDAVKTICTKYGLILGPADKFKARVPDKNITEMLAFKVDDADRCYEYFRRMSVWMSTLGHKTIEQVSQFMDKTTYEIGLKEELQQGKVTWDSGYRPSPIQVAAPVGDFDTRNMEVVEGELISARTYPDPVVLFPVYRNMERFFLIMTAWGPEASDPLVANEKLN